jgi:Uma2 family endonuclease
MNVALRKSWTQDAFISWAQTQSERYEFDGSQPVAMTGGNAAHAMIGRNVNFALRSRLRGGVCSSMGPDAGIETVGGAVRYPDALVTCAKVSPADLTIAGVIVVFEVVSAGSTRTDRIDKVVEYAAVPSIRRYVIVESASVAVTVLERGGAGEPWTASILADETAVLRMPELDIEIPVAAFYEDIVFAADAQGA